MRPANPPRLAVALLQRFGPPNEPLVGDLVEEFRSRRRSRLWFWRQALLALFFGYKRSERRPLALGLVDPADRSLDVQALPRPPSRINLAGSPVPWIGGLGLIALGVLIAVMTPWAAWLALYLLAAGVLSGIVMVILSRRRVLMGSEADRPGVLFDREESVRRRRSN